MFVVCVVIIWGIIVEGGLVKLVKLGFIEFWEWVIVNSVCYV